MKNSPFTQEEYELEDFDFDFDDTFVEEQPAELTLSDIEADSFEEIKDVSELYSPAPPKENRTSWNLEVTQLQVQLNTND